MNTTVLHEPAMAHRLAAAVLFEMRRELERRRRDGDPRFDHAKIFERLLLLVGDELRRADPPLDLGLQTTFRAPRASGDTRLVILETITTLLYQCVEEGWMLPPQDASKLNYVLTESGRELAAELLQPKGNDSSDIELAASHREALQRVVAQWLAEARPAVALRREMLRLAGRAWAEPVAVPHYDFGDPRLRPYLEGVLRRVRGAARDTGAS